MSMSSPQLLQVISPVDGSIYAQRPAAHTSEIDAILHKAKKAQHAWRHTPIAERAAVCQRFVHAFVEHADAIATELTWQMGRPISQTPGEVRGFRERADYMISIAEASLRDRVMPDKPGFHRLIRQEPWGVVLTIAAWNYPYLIAVNSVVPAIMAGNAVVLKHSTQTPLCAERFEAAFRAAGLMDGVFQVIHTSHAHTEWAVKHPLVDFVAFTGSVDGGRAVQNAMASRFAGVGLELGGNDPAYVRHDADLNHAIENLVDGSFFNSGQSCCGIERIYVHRNVYPAFLEGFVHLTQQYRMGNPLDPQTNLGPVVRTRAADAIRTQVRDAIDQGARGLINPQLFPVAQEGTPYVAPQVLVDVHHGMTVMTEETFGPVVGIMPVGSDEEAIALMNDSHYGLTACVWTRDVDAAQRIGDQVETGTWFMNRCDYLDPALAWTGVKDSGRGCTLSELGYMHLTRPKSFHMRLNT